MLENGEPDARLIHRYHTQKRQRHTRDRETQTQTVAGKAVLGLLRYDLISLPLLCYGMTRADPCREEGSMKFGINVWVTDKNLQALALSTSGATLNPAKRTKYDHRNR